jgi:hypothetical protein
MASEQVEKPLFPRQKGAKPTQHLACPSLQKMAAGRPVTQLS